MTRKLFLLLAVSALAASAADRPDFSGKWVLNTAKSDFGILPVPERFERTIVQTSTEVKLTTIQGVAEKESRSDVTFVTDGMEHTQMIGTYEVKITGTWRSNQLEVVSKRTVQGGVPIATTDLWTLAADGKSMTVDSKIHTRNADFQVKMTLTRR
jgi:hypothetical protein